MGMLSDRKRNGINVRYWMMQAVELRVPILYVVRLFSCWGGEVGGGGGT